MAAEKKVVFRRPALPPSLEPCGLTRFQAAAFLGIGVRLFDDMVKAETFPRPKVIGRERIWSKIQLEHAFQELPEEKAERVINNDWD